MDSNEHKPRTVTLHLQDEDYERIVRAFGEAPHTELYKAIGYLSFWNRSFPNVSIYTDGTTDLVAVYKNEDGSRGYTIGAIWDASLGKYGFHS